LKSFPPSSPSLLSLPFLGFGIPQDIFGLLHSLCL
jgi:hypothetical protein